MCDGIMNGGPDIASGSYATPNNTIGVGDPIPYSVNNLGSGDLFGTNNKKKKRPAAKKEPMSMGQSGLATLPYIVMTNK